MKKLVLPLMMCLTLLASPLDLGAEEKGTQQKKKEFETSRNANFLKKKPFLNKEAPDVEVYDEKGNPFRLAQSRGKHTVVVFGCLT